MSVTLDDDLKFLYYRKEFGKCVDHMIDAGFNVVAFHMEQFMEHVESRYMEQGVVRISRHFNMILEMDEWA